MIAGGSKSPITGSNIKKLPIPSSGNSKLDLNKSLQINI
jgi:hypothetical protein